MDRCLLGEGEMSSGVVVIDGIGGKDPAQMGVAEDDDMIKAFPTGRPDQPLRGIKFARELGNGKIGKIGRYWRGHPHRQRRAARRTEEQANDQIIESREEGK
jgi:hypothetical protein